MVANVAINMANTSRQKYCMLLRCRKLKTKTYFELAASHLKLFLNGALENGKSS